jgi:hypothetical protein
MHNSPAGVDHGRGTSGLQLFISSDQQHDHFLLCSQDGPESEPAFL